MVRENKQETFEKKRSPFSQTEDATQHPNTNTPYTTHREFSTVCRRLIEISLLTAYDLRSKSCAYSSGYRPTTQVNRPLLALTSGFRALRCCKIHKSRLHFLALLSNAANRLSIFQAQLS